MITHYDEHTCNYGEVCVSDDEGGHCGFSVCDADKDDM